MIIKPLQKWILLEVTEYKEAKHGLIIPEHLRKKIPRGKVLSHGKYCDDTYVEGEMVIYQKQGTKALPDDRVLCPEHRIFFKEQWLKDSIKNYKDVHNSSKETQQ